MMLIPLLVFYFAPAFGNTKSLVNLITKTVFLLIIFWNRKTWDRGTVNGMQHFFGNR